MNTKSHLVCLTAVLSLVACNPKSEPEAANPRETTAFEANEPGDYLGLDEKSAGAKADKAGVKWRIIEVDGESRPVTMDYLEGRLNFSIKDGRVIRVTNG